MVILDSYLTGGGTSKLNVVGASPGNMLSANSPYINPDDIITPVSSSSEIDAKTSPLAMLAKTCSQIGSDPLQPSLSKLNGSKKSSSSPVMLSNAKESSRSRRTADQPRSRSSSTEIRVTDSMISHRKSSSPVASRHLSSASLPVLRSGLDMNKQPSSVTLPSSSSSCPIASNPFLASFASSLSESSGSSVCRDPLCRDPLCPTAVRNQQMLAATSSLSSYNSLIAASSQSYYKEAMMAYAAHQRMAAAAAALASAPPGSAGGALPYVCNWVAGTDYCGRRFGNSEELLVHVKTHTNPSTSDPRALSSVPANVSATSSSMSTMPSPSPRFHPYARPHPPPPSAPTPPTTPLPPSLAALASHPYASLYTSLFARPPLL